jgi:hypothetical protein
LDSWIGGSSAEESHFRGTGVSPVSEACQTSASRRCHSSIDAPALTSIMPPAFRPPKFYGTGKGIREGVRECGLRSCFITSRERCLRLEAAGCVAPPRRISCSIRLVVAPCRLPPYAAHRCARGYETASPRHRNRSDRPCRGGIERIRPSPLASTSVRFDADDGSEQHVEIALLGNAELHQGTIVRTERKLLVTATVTGSIRLIG